MGSNASDVEMAHCAEGSETTIEIKIKTLDSQTYNLRVNKCVPVPLLKEKIADVTGILSEQQRLICRGKVLKDDELLSAYHVEDGHTLHLVVRQPGQSIISGNAGNEATTSNPTRHQGTTVARSIVFEAVNVDQGSNEFPSIGQILSSLFGQNAGMPANGGPAPSDTGSSGPAQSSPLPTAVRVELDQQLAPLHLQSEAALGSAQPNVIPDSLTTISQYIDFMRDAFRNQGLNANGRIDGSVDHRTTSSHAGGTQNQERRSDSVSGRHELPTAALLAEAMHCTRQLLVEQAGECLSQLSRQLGDLVNVTDSAMRRNLQHSAMGSGVLLQNLGSLLLELGRTTMMLRISPAPSEAVVNAGPAVFISPSGPNPLMVPPVPFFPGTRSVHMGTIFSGFSSQGSLPHPRDIDIHVRTSGPVTVASTNPSELAGAQQAQEHTDRTGNGSHANISEAFAGAMGGAPFAVESGVRVLPLRTVVAVPAGISRPPSGSSSGGVGLIYPLLTRIQQRANVNGSDTRNGQSPNEPTNNGIHANQHLILQPSSQAHEAGNLEPPIDTNLGNSSQTPSVQHNGQGPLSQLLDRLHLIGSLFSGENVQGNGTTQQASMAGSAEQVDARNAGTAEASGVSDEGLRFSYLVQQIMPFISQGGTAAGQSAPVDSISTPPQAASESLNSELDGSNDSRSPQQHQRDPPENPNSKRQRTSE